MIISLLRTLSWRCSGLLSALRPWEYRSFLLSLLSWFIRTLTRRLFLSCFMFLAFSWLTLGIDHVYAQAETPTPTNEPWYVFENSTPTPTLPALCNVAGTPAGWGQKTPYLNWSLKCNKCFDPGTPTPGPGSIFYKTPGPTATLTPSPTASNIFTNYSLNYNGAYPAENVVVPFTVEGCMYYNCYGDSAYLYGDYYTGHHYKFTIEKHYKRSSTVAQNTSIIIYNDSPDLMFATDNLAGQTYVLVPGENKNIQIPLTGAYNEFDFAWTFEILNSHGNTQAQFHIAWAGVNSGRWTTYDTFKWYKGDYQGPNAPTPTPGASYCSSVDGYTPNGNNAGGVDISQYLPSFTTGWGRCAVLGPVTADLAWIPDFLGFPDSFGWPGVEICFKPVYFGDIQVLGMKWDIDLICAAMAGIWIALRMMR